jgi:predicted PurR-regulated permease PerM
MHRLPSFALVMVIGATTIYAMVVGRDILLPLAVAFVVWYFVNVLASALWRLSGERVPRGFTVGLGALAVLGLGWAIGDMLASNLTVIAEELPGYEAKFDVLIHQWGLALGFSEPPRVADLIGRIDFTAWARSAAATLAGFAGNAGLVLLYVFFLLLEQGGLNRKLSRLFNNDQREAEARVVIARIDRDMQTYIRVKVLLALIGALLGWGIMAAVDLDFAPFWAALLFLTYFIPVIGTPLALVGPALFSLVQFESLTPFIIVVGGNLAIQLVIENFIEPAMMGRSLNLSPFVSIVALVVFGAIWGLVGMVLCVPILVSVMIVLAHFRRTRPLAVLLSAKGEVSDLA